MSRFIIFSKNGVAKYESVTALNSDGEQVKGDSLEYHGSWMAECYITINVKSAYPIDFQIGDFIDYRGERFTLENVPAVNKKARRGTNGEGFEYKGIKFSARQSELTDIRFLDVVLADNELHFTSLPEFPFYAASIEDYADRLQANTNRWCTENGMALADYWLFITPDKNRFVQRAGCLRKNNDQWEGLSVAQATTIWEGIYGSDGSKVNVSDEKKDVSITISGENVWESLARIKNNFGLNFINRGRKVIIGAAGIETDHLFKYGKGQGLYEMERQMDSSQQVITKLYAYGSDKNMPVRYYNNVQVECYALVRRVTYRNTEHPNGSVLYLFVCDLDIGFDNAMFPESAFVGEEPETEKPIYEVTVKVNGHELLAHVSVGSDSRSCRLSIVNPSAVSGLVEPGVYDDVVSLRPSDEVEFVKGFIKGAWPSNHTMSSNVKMEAYSTVSSIESKSYTQDTNLSIAFIIPVDYAAAGLLLPSDTYPYQCVNLKIGESKVSGYVEEAQNGKCLIRVQWLPNDFEETNENNIQEYSQTAAAAFYNLIAVGSKVYINGVNAKTFPTVEGQYQPQELPNNMSVNRLMLPGFPSMSLYDWVKANGGTGCNDNTGQATWKGYTAIFSRDKNRPFIMSINADELGVREASKVFDGSDDTEEIFPTLEGTGYDIIQHADVVEDNGLFAEGSTAPTINLTIPLLDQLGQLVNEGTENGGSPTISMKDGYCGGRDLPIKKVTNKDGRWVVLCERAYDSAVELYFPYSYNISIGEQPTADEAYQIRGADVSGYDGDHFVFTGIPLPSTYIDAASVKLLENALEFLSKNEYTRYTYLPKVDEIFMANEAVDAIKSGRVPLHDSIKEGDLLNFKDDDLLIPDSLVFIDSLTIKENGNNGIPTYDVTLRTEKTVGTIQRIQNQIGNISNTIANGVGGGMAASQVRNMIEEQTKDKFLSKQKDDSTDFALRIRGGVKVGSGNKGMDSNGNVNANNINAHDIDGNNATLNQMVLQSLQVGDTFSSGLGGEGGIFKKNANGETYLEADKMYIRIKAYFDTVEIRRYLHSNGNRIASNAGANCSFVEYLNANNEKVDSASNAVKFRCYFKANDGDNTITNDFVVGDQIFCHVTNVASGSMTMKDYWRLCIAKSSSTVEVGGVEYHWIDLSNRVSETLVIGGTSYTHAGYRSDSDIPAADDDMIQLGHISDKTRQGAIIESVSGEVTAPTYNVYQGINDFTLNGKNEISLGYDTQTGHAFLNVYGNMYIGAKGNNPSTYIRYTQDDGTAQHQPKLEIKAHIEFTNSDAELDALVQGHQNNYDDTELRNAISTINTTTEDLQRQIDGQIESWFYNGVPSDSVLPESDWKAKDITAGNNNERLKHLGDMYYDNQTGYAYRYTNTGTEANPIFTWTPISDSAVVKALADAAAALGLADTKGKIISTAAGVLPSPPYKTNDIWVNATYPANGSTWNNEILKCKANINRAVGDVASINDWEKANRYIGDAEAQAKVDNFVANTFTPYQQQIKSQMDKKAETWRQASNPADAWTTDALKAEHVGDLWMDISANGGNKTYIYTDKGVGASPRYTWEAQEVPDEVFDAIDGKAEIFVSKPTTYNINDMWIIETGLASSDMPSGCTAGDIVFSSANRKNSYNKADWSKKHKYTDDTTVNNFISGPYATTIASLRNQIDQKAETWRQSTAPDETEGWSDAEKAKHVGDMWYNTNNNRTYIYVDNGEGENPRYEWVEEEIPQEIFDAIDGKSAIYVNAVNNPPTNYKMRDLWILPTATTVTVSGTTYKYIQGEVLTCVHDYENAFSWAHWRKKVGYTDDTALEEYKTVVTGLVSNAVTSANGYTDQQIRDAQTAINNAYDYLTVALRNGTAVVGGLILSTLIALRDGNEEVKSGINGAYDASHLGGGIAAWYGGYMIDHEAAPTMPNYAKSLFRFDGSGYLAGGNISWNADGDTVTKGTVRAQNFYKNQLFVRTTNNGTNYDNNMYCYNVEPTDDSATIRFYHTRFNSDQDLEKYVFNTYGKVAREWRENGCTYDAEQVLVYNFNSLANAPVGLPSAALFEGKEVEIFNQSASYSAYIYSACEDFNPIATAYTYSGSSWIPSATQQSYTLAPGWRLVLRSDGNKWAVIERNAINADSSGQQAYVTEQRLAEALSSYASTSYVSDYYLLKTAIADWAKQPTKPTYTKSEVGLGNVGNYKAVSVDANQGLSSTEQSNARANIGAGTSSFSGSYNDLTNKPTIVSQIKVGSTAYNPTSGVVSLPPYPTTLPASDVYAWAKAATKPSYAWSEITDKPSTYTPSAHTHDDRYYTETEIDTKLSDYILSSDLQNGYSWFGSASAVGNRDVTISSNGIQFVINGSGQTSIAKLLCMNSSALLTFNDEVLATRNWVTGLGYITSSALNGYATQSWVNQQGFVKSSGVTSIAAGTGLAGGTITSTGTISISSTYQTYISHGETAYGWGNHANAGYALESETDAKLANYVTLATDQNINSVKTFVNVVNNAMSAQKVAIGYDGITFITTESGGNPPRPTTVSTKLAFSSSSVGLTLDGEPIATHAWVNNQGYLTSIPSLTLVQKVTSGGYVDARYLRINESLVDSATDQSGTILTLKAFLPLAGGTLSGDLKFVDSDNKISVSGGKLVLYSANGITLNTLSVKDFSGNSFITTTAISDMATKTWVGQQGYLTSSSISDMATKTWVGQNYTFVADGTAYKMKVGDGALVGLTQYGDGEFMVSTASNATYASSAGSVAWTNVSGRPTNVSSFTNDSGYITGITKAMVTTALGYTPPTTDTNTARLQVSDTTNKRINTKESTGNYIQFAGGTNKITISDGTNSFDVAITPSVTFPVTSVVGQTGAVTAAQIASALTSAGYKLTDTTYSAATQSAAGLMSAADKTKLDGIATGATNVVESTVSGWGFTKNNGTVTSVKVGTTSYNPSSGVVSLPAYPTTLPASDVYAWAKAASKPSYSLSEISNRQQSLIEWGGPNLVGSVSPLEVATIDDLGHNKLAFASAATITIQYSRDNGATWTSYGASDTDRRALLTLTSGYSIGGRTGASNTVNDKLRIILNSNNAGGNIYTSLKRLLLYVSTNGSGGCSVKVEHRTIANYRNNVDTWSEIGTFGLSGWSGWNSIPCAVTFGGSNDQTYQSAQIRLTFGVTSVSSTYGNLVLLAIRGIGFPLWGSPSTLASTGHLYSFDMSQNAAFPANVSASGFVKSGSSSAYVLTGDGGHAAISGLSVSYASSAGAVAWANVSSRPTKLSDFTNDVGYITSYTDTKNTAGSTDTSSKIFLIGATSQAANPQTYSQDTAYVGTDGHLYSDGKQVVNLSGSQSLTNKTYNGYTLAAACAKGVTDNSTSTAVTSTDTNLITARTLYYAGYVKSSGVTSIATGTGLTGGTITGTGTISINSTYQTYISNGNTAYGWGNHANVGYYKEDDSPTFTDATFSGTVTIGKTIISNDGVKFYSKPTPQTNHNLLLYKNSSLRLAVKGITGSTEGSENVLAYVSEIPTQTIQLTNNSGFITSSALDGYATQFWVNQQGYVKSSGVTSVATGTGLTGGTITGTGTISINSTYQTYISNGNTAYGWGNHANAGYVTEGTLNSGWSWYDGTISTGNKGVSVDYSGIKFHYNKNQTTTWKILSADYDALRGGDILKYGDEILATRSWANGVFATTSALSNYLPVAGGMVTGELYLEGEVEINNLSSFSDTASFANGFTITDGDVYVDTCTSFDIKCSGITRFRKYVGTTLYNTVVIQNSRTTFSKPIEVTGGITATAGLSGNKLTITEGTATPTYYAYMEIDRSTPRINFSNSFYARTWHFDTAIEQSSDSRLKDILGSVDLTVEAIASAPAIKYAWKSDKNKFAHVGTIAQYWQGVLPEVVFEGGDGYLSLDYISTSLASCIMVARKVVDHERRIKELEKENERLRAEVECLQKNMQKN